MHKVALAFGFALLLAVPANAQTVTGTPGSPSATSTIDGRQIPPPPAAFGGTINLDAQNSTPYWQPQVVPPKGAPNILLIYAAYLAYTDHEIGRVVQAVEDMGKLDNTLIIYISGDNGGSAEGSPAGTPNEMTFFNGIEVPVAEQLLFYEKWSSQYTYPHMAVGWTTPFR